MRPLVRLRFRDRDADASGHRLCDRAPVGRIERAIDLAELKRRRDAVTGADHLIGRRN